jgi:hypothetical protein
LHPSWPAMHSSGSSCSYWLPAVAKLSPQQYCEALRLDYAVAYARTVAGKRHHKTFFLVVDREWRLGAISRPYLMDRYILSFGSGVHYPMDNFAGLNLGLNIIKDKLPGHLANYYGYKEDMVRAKLESLAFDWETFDPYSCTIDGIPVGERLV